ncbi:MAG: 4Fe-4S binding protein [Bacteroidota bacterium]
MPVKIAVASGKGGTGKTSVSLQLFRVINKYWTSSVQLADCDVEEPNDLIFFPSAKIIFSENVNQFIPEINRDACTYCGKCQEYCEFNAIVVIPPVEFAEVTPELCHSCGACTYACEFDAIRETPHQIGKVNGYSVNGNPYPDLLEGRLKIGSPMQTLLIRNLKKKINKEAEVILFDAPPGTSCPVVTTVFDADYVVLVTEPTPFGLHDLQLSIEVLKEMDKKFGVFINKDGMGSNETEKFLNSNHFEILGRFPFNQVFASKYAKAEVMENISEETEFVFKNLAETLRAKLT